MSRPPPLPSAGQGSDANGVFFFVIQESMLFFFCCCCRCCRFISSISAYYAERVQELTSSRTLRYSYSGSPDNGDDNKNNDIDELQLVVQELEGCSFEAAGGGGPDAVDLWNGSGGYARLPESLLDAMDKGEDITFEFGAVMR